MPGMRGGRAIGLDLGRLTTISLVLAWFNLRLLMDAHIRDMVKFRKSAVNAGSRDQQVAIVGIFSATVFTVFRFKSRNGYDKISRSKVRAMHYTGINGTEGRDCGREEAPNDYSVYGERRKFSHRGLGRSPRS